MTAGPLDGITVVEAGGFIAGPFAGQLLGDYGARVIKIEPPEGDPIRRWGVLDEDGRGLWWPSLARNKESVVIDFKDPGGRALAARLFARADIVVENFAPGRLEGWGLDYQSIVPDNPGLIMVHVSGFGQDGPRARDRGFGSIAEAMGGLRALAGFPDRPPVRAGFSMGDALAALFAVNGALAALAERERSGRGQEVDVALYESVFALTESVLADWELGGVIRQRTGSSLAGVAPANVYKAADGHEVLIAANGDGLFERLCEAMGAARLAEDPRFADHQSRGRNAAELDELVGAWTATLPAAALEALLDDHAVPRGRIYTPPDMVRDEQFQAREMITRLTAPGYPEPVPMPNVVPKFGRTRAQIRYAGVELGHHTEAVRREFGGPGGESR